MVLGEEIEVRHGIDVVVSAGFKGREFGDVGRIRV